MEVVLYALKDFEGMQFVKVRSFLQIWRPSRIGGLLGALVKQFPKYC